MIKVIKKKKDILIFLPEDFQIFQIKKPKEKVKLRRNRTKILNRLVLGISNLCNLKCVYCYANGGSYKGRAQLMDFDKAVQIINKAYQIWDEINSIQFFGGEPLVAFNNIKKIVKYVEEMYKKKRINKMPVFSVVSNGTIITEEMISFFKKYKFRITISHDGPLSVTNYTRINRNGKGMGKEISKNLKNLIKNNLNVGIECTYTRFHIEKNISIWDCILYFYKEFGIRSIHIPPVTGKAEDVFSIFPEYTKELISGYIEAVNKCIESWLEGKNIVSFSFLDRIVGNLVQKKKNIFLCPAFTDTLGVWYTGDIYPCFMFWGIEKFKIANINENVEKIKEKFYNFYHKNLMSKMDIKKCKNCWCKWLCTKCLGANYFENKSLWNTPVYHCEWYKKMCEEVIYLMSKMRRDENKWSKMLNNLKKLNV